MENQNYKFKGGVWMGFMAYTWPFGKLEVSSDQLIIAVEGLPFDRSRREFRFRHDEIEKIKVIKVFPIIGYGIHIYPRDKKVSSFLYFWYLSFGFKKLIKVLIEFGWLPEQK